MKWLTRWLTNKQTSWRTVLLEKLTNPKLVKKFPAFYGIRRFIISFTSARHLSLSWGGAEYQVHATTSYFLKIHFYIIHLCIGLPSGLFPSVLPTTTLYAPHLYPVCATYSVHLILLDSITRTMLGEEYRSFSSSLCCLLHSPDKLPHLGSNTFLSTLFSNNLSLCSTLNIRDQVLHSCKKEEKLLLFIPWYLYFWIANWKANDSWTNDSKRSLISI